MHLAAEERLITGGVHRAGNGGILIGGEPAGVVPGPRARARRAVASPSPDAAPVTSATLSFSENIESVFPHAPGDELGFACFGAGLRNLFQRGFQAG